MTLPANLKHDLRTPLNQIIGYSEMLMEQAEDLQHGRALADLRKIHTAGQGLLGHLNHLFDSAHSNQEPLDAKLLLHNLRTPLNQIIGYSELLQEDALSGAGSELVPDLQKIGLSARRLLGLIVDQLTPAITATDAAPAADPSASLTTETIQLLSLFYPSGDHGPARPGSEGGLLLVVDDDELNRDMLQRRLERLGYNVRCAGSGAEALAQLKHAAFDLLLLDIMMPEMSGYQVLEEMQADTALRDVPVIVLSALDKIESVAACLELGAQDYLLKPFDPVLLRARIDACLSRKRLRDREVLYLKQIKEEQRRSDDLLRVILPQDVAEELKKSHLVRPRRYEDVAVLFCDVVGFTEFCDRNPAEMVLLNLQSLVEEYEDLAELHQLEKIKTIGDSFMATGGLLGPLDNPVLHCVQCGLEMVAAANRLPVRWQVRVGIHVGPVVGGVVGRKKYMFDIWGDTVNTASRVESLAPNGAVCLSSAAWERVAAHCRGQSLGIIQVKGKGEMELFHVQGLSW